VTPTVTNRVIGLRTAGIGFNIQHNAGLQADFNRPWINKLMSITLDMISGSSLCGTGSTWYSIAKNGDAKRRTKRWC
jgi:hypothetical protein